jgi:hypothetical protein
MDALYAENGVPVGFFGIQPKGKNAGLKPATLIFHKKNCNFNFFSNFALQSALTWKTKKNN